MNMYMNIANIAIFFQATFRDFRDIHIVNIGYRGNPNRSQYIDRAESIFAAIFILGYIDNILIKWNGRVHQILIFELIR